MRVEQILDAPKTFVLVFDTGEEATGGLLAFAKTERLTAAHFTAIGAFQDCKLGYFNWQTKQYEAIHVPEQVEVLSLVGNVAEQDGQPKLHAHVVVGKWDGTAHGGHLLEARVRPTLEVVLTESPKHLVRRFDPETGLALIRPAEK
ncbi:MAG TPA: PPC domain-containing DNA-binding protein [Pirellulales bacterium]|nr:PPC domain-containing DNA-binding protein [Pirellulales bacterium]